jgi:flagellar FliJ protein
MAMSTLEKITKLAKEARDNAGVALARERMGQQELLKQIEMLNSYRNDYCDKLHEEMSKGLPSSLLSDYQVFLGSLDATISTANEQLRQLDKRINHKKENWKDKQRRLVSFDTLSERRKAKEMDIEQRQERKQSDEINTNSAARKSMAAQYEL